MEVSKTECLTIDYVEGDNMLKARWYPKSVDLDPEEFKQELNKWRDMIIEHQPERLFVDSREMLFTILPEMQEWFVADIFTAYASAGVKRNAFVESEAVFTAISVQQTMEENKNAPFETMYFNSVEGAMGWLLES